MHFVVYCQQILQIGSILGLAVRHRRPENCFGTNNPTVGVGAYWMKFYESDGTR